MYEYLVGEYLKNMTIDEVIKYGIENNIIINEHDANILLTYANRYYKVFMNGDPTDILKEIKKKIDPETYKEAYKLYINYKNKYTY